MIYLAFMNTMALTLDTAANSNHSIAALHLTARLTNRLLEAGLIELPRLCTISLVALHAIGVGPVSACELARALLDHNLEPCWFKKLSIAYTTRRPRELPKDFKPLTEAYHNTPEDHLAMEKAMSALRRDGIEFVLVAERTGISIWRRSEKKLRGSGFG